MLKSDVLDNFIFIDERIYLKDFHIERSHEAYRRIFPSVTADMIVVVYDKIEKDLRFKIDEHQMVRLIFSCEQMGRTTHEIVNKVLLADPVRLEILTSLKNPAGCGAQNYKWAQRELWNQLIELKGPEADDIIAINQLDQVTETSRFNLFFYCEEVDQVFTPTLNSGCVNGVFRRFAMSHKSIDLPQLGKKALVEKDISVAELQASPHIYTIFVANSARGVLNACLTTKNPIQKS